MSSTTATIKSSSSNIIENNDADIDAVAAADDDNDTTTLGTVTTTTTVPLPTSSNHPPSVVPDANTDAGGDGKKQQQQQQAKDDDDDDECSLFAIDFMFEGNQPSRMEHFTWNLAAAPAANTATTAATAQSTVAQTEKEAAAEAAVPRTIQVALSIADDNPGAVQSGHYLWPAAKLLADYLVQQQLSSSTTATNQPCSVLELGAGCALVSLTAWQLWQDSLQCLIITDHDPGTLERARNNYESTLQQIMDATCQEEDEMDTINNLGSINVLFESLTWSCKKKHDDNDNSEDDDDDAARIRSLLEEHSNTNDSKVDVILGSDLIYDIHVVEPLLTTAARFLSKKTQRQQSSSSCCGSSGIPCFLLSQSFAYDKETEQEIDATCQKLGLQRKILWQEEQQDDDIQDATNEQDQEKHPIEKVTDMDKKKKATPSGTLLSAKKRIQEFRWRLQE